MTHIHATLPTPSLLRPDSSAAPASIKLKLEVEIPPELARDFVDKMPQLAAGMVESVQQRSPADTQAGKGLIPVVINSLENKGREIVARGVSSVLSAAGSRVARVGEHVGELVSRVPGGGVAVGLARAGVRVLRGHKS